MTIPNGSRLRVISVIHPFRPEFSGEGEWWLRMIPLLRQRGVDVEIMTTVPASAPGVATAVEDDIVVHRVLPDPRMPAYPGRIAALLRSLRQDRSRFNMALFHSTNYDAVYASCLAGRALGWKTIYKMTLHRADDLASIRATGRFGRVRAASIALADGFISMSKVMIGRYEGRRFLRDRLLVVPQGVDTTRFSPADPGERARLRASLQLSPDARVALFCGAVIYRKGVDILIDAWRAIKARVPGAVLLLAGPNHHGGLDEPDFIQFSAEIERRIGALGFTDSVRLLGYRADTERLYRAADLFVFPSRNEGWGTVISEAMASGLPCVVSPMDGIGDEHIEHGRDGLIVRTGDPSDYASAIAGLLNDDAQRHVLGGRARTRIVERVAMDLVADKYAGFFRQIAAGQAA